MPQATLKLVAKLAGVAPMTVSRVVNGSENVAASTRKKILAVIRDLDYTPNMYAANLRRKRWDGESTSGSKERLAGAGEPMRDGWSSRSSLPRSPGGAFPFHVEEGRALAQQMIRLRKDLDRLRKHAEC